MAADDDSSISTSSPQWGQAVDFMIGAFHQGCLYATKTIAFYFAGGPKTESDPCAGCSRLPRDDAKLDLGGVAPARLDLRAGASERHVPAC